MTDIPPPEATLQLDVQDLDAILEEVHPDGDAPTDAPLEAGYHLGKVDGSRQMHRKLIDAADVILE